LFGSLALGQVHIHANEIISVRPARDSEQGGEANTLSAIAPMKLEFRWAVRECPCVQFPSTRYGKGLFLPFRR
jgi:hypothetical protein